MNYEKLCPNCMQERENSHGVCPHCGFSAEHDRPDKFFGHPYFTILKGRYLMGTPQIEDVFGIMYIAMDLVTERRVYIRQKLTPLGMDWSVNDDIFMMFGKTLQNLGSLPGILSVLDVFEVRQEHKEGYSLSLYMVQAYVPGISLRKYIENHGGRISYAEAELLLKPMENSLAVIHDQGIYHGNISPDQILIGSDGRAWLCNISRSFRDPDRVDTCILLPSEGKPIENNAGPASWGPRSDVFELAAVLYFCICGEEVEGEDILKREAVKTKTPSSMGIILSASLERVLMKALDEGPGGRYDTIAEFTEAKKNALNEAQQTSLSGERQSGKKPQKSKAKSKSGKRDLIILIAVGAVALIAAVSAIVLIAVRRSDGRSEQANTEIAESFGEREEETGIVTNSEGVEEETGTPENVSETEEEIVIVDGPGTEEETNSGES